MAENEDYLAEGKDTGEPPAPLDPVPPVQAPLELVAPGGNGHAAEPPSAEELERAEHVAAIARQLALRALQDENFLAFIGTNLAWMMKHPGSMVASTPEQFARRAEYAETLDAETKGALIEATRQIAAGCCHHIAGYLVPPRKPLIVVPGMVPPQGRLR